MRIKAIEIKLFTHNCCLFFHLYAVTVEHLLGQFWMNYSSNCHVKYTAVTKTLELFIIFRLKRVWLLVQKSITVTSSLRPFGCFHSEKQVFKNKLMLKLCWSRRMQAVYSSKALIATWIWLTKSQNSTVANSISLVSVLEWRCPAEFSRFILKHSVWWCDSAVGDLAVMEGMSLLIRMY